MRQRVGDVRGAGETGRDAVAALGDELRQPVPGHLPLAPSSRPKTMASAYTVARRCASCRRRRRSARERRLGSRSASSPKWSASSSCAEQCRRLGDDAGAPVQAGGGDDAVVGLGGGRLVGRRRRDRASRRTGSRCPTARSATAATPRAGRARPSSRSACAETCRSPYACHSAHGTHTAASPQIARALRVSGSPVDARCT